MEQLDQCGVQRGDRRPAPARCRGRDVLGPPVHHGGQERIHASPTPRSLGRGPRCAVVGDGHRQPVAHGVLLEHGLDLDHLGTECLEPGYGALAQGAHLVVERRVSERWRPRHLGRRAGAVEGGGPRRLGARQGPDVGGIGPDGDVEGGRPRRRCAVPWAPWSTGRASPSRGRHRPGPGRVTASSRSARSTTTGCGSNRLRRIPWRAGPCPRRWRRRPRPRSHPGCGPTSTGWQVGPKTMLSVSAFQPSSGVLVLPTTTQPGGRAGAPRAASRPRPRAAGEDRRALTWSRSPLRPRGPSRRWGSPPAGPGSSPARHGVVDARRQRRVRRRRRRPRRR